MTPTDPTPINRFKTLDKDLARIVQLEQATQFVGRPMVALGIALVFIVGAALVAMLAAGGQSNTMIIVAAAAFGA